VHSSMRTWDGGDVWVYFWVYCWGDDGEERFTDNAVMDEAQVELHISQ